MTHKKIRDLHSGLRNVAQIATSRGWTLEAFQEECVAYFVAAQDEMKTKYVELEESDKK